MPKKRLDYQTSHRGFVTADLQQYLALANDTPLFIPNGGAFDEERQKLNDLLIQTGILMGEAPMHFDMVENVFDEEYEEKIRDFNKRYMEIIDSVRKKMDDTPEYSGNDYSVQKGMLRACSLYGKYLQADISPADLYQTTGGMGFVGNGGVAPFVMDMNFYEFPKDPEKLQEYYRQMGEEFNKEDSPLIKNFNLGLENLENVVLYIDTRKKLEKGPRNQKEKKALERDLERAEAGIERTARELSESLPLNKQYALRDEFKEENLAATLEKKPFLRTNTTDKRDQSNLLHNAEINGNLDVGIQGAKCVSAMMGAGYNAEYALEQTRRIMALQDAVKKCSEHIGKDGKADPEKATLFDQIGSSLMNPLSAGNFPETLKRLHDQGLDPASYLDAVTYTLGQGIRNIYTSEKGLEGEKFTEPENEELNEYRQEMEAVQPTPGALSAAADVIKDSMAAKADQAEKEKLAAMAVQGKKFLSYIEDRRAAQDKPQKNADIDKFCQALIESDHFHWNSSAFSAMKNTMKEYRRTYAALQQNPNDVETAGRLESIKETLANQAEAWINDPAKNRKKNHLKNSFDFNRFREVAGLLDSLDSQRAKQAMSDVKVWLPCQNAKKGYSYRAMLSGIRGALGMETRKSGWADISTVKEPAERKSDMSLDQNDIIKTAGNHGKNRIGMKGLGEKIGGNQKDKHTGAEKVNTGRKKVKTSKNIRESDLDSSMDSKGLG